MENSLFQNLHPRQDAQLHEGVDQADCTQHWSPLIYLHIKTEPSQILAEQNSWTELKKNMSKSILLSEWIEQMDTVQNKLKNRDCINLLKQLIFFCFISEYWYILQSLLILEKRENFIYMHTHK